MFQTSFFKGFFSVLSLGRGRRAERDGVGCAYIGKAGKKYAKETADVNVRRPPRPLAPSLGEGRRAKRAGVGFTYVAKAGKGYDGDISDV